MRRKREKSKEVVDYHYDYFKVLDYAKNWMICNNFANKFHAEFILTSAFPSIKNRIILDVIEEIFNR